MANTVIQSSGIALINNGKIFLIKPYRSEDKWGIPKGHLDGDEDIQKTAIREFTEETGIKIVGVLKYFSTVTTRYKDTVKNVNVYKCVGTGNEEFISSNLIIEGDAVGNPENTEGRWFTYNEALEKVHAYQIPIINKLKSEDNTFRSFHDNRVTNLATGELLYNETIILLLYDTRMDPRQHLYLIQKYLNISDSVVLFIKEEDTKLFYTDAIPYFKGSIPEKMKVIIIPRKEICINDIVTYANKNLKRTNIIFGSNKELKSHSMLYELCEILDNMSGINVLSLKKYAM